MRNRLSEIWGENKADYFVNPARAPRKTSKDLRSEEGVHRNLSNPKNRGSRTGLYAYMIWDNLREDAGNKFKIYSLDKDLHVCIFFSFIQVVLVKEISA